MSREADKKSEVLLLFENLRNEGVAFFLNMVLDDLRKLFAGANLKFLLKEFQVLMSLKN